MRFDSSSAQQVDCAQVEIMTKIDDKTLWTILLVVFTILAVLGVVYYQSMGVSMAPSEKPSPRPHKVSRLTTPVITSGSACRGWSAVIPV